MAQRYGEFMEMSRLVYNGEHWYWKDKVRMRRSSEQVEVLEALLGSAENPDSVATSILAEHPDHVADILLATDEDLGLSEGQLDRIGRALADKVAESRDAEVSYGLSSYDGEIDHLTAIYSAGDARQEYEEKSAKFGAWRRRRLRRR